MGFIGRLPAGTCNPLRLDGAPDTLHRARAVSQDPHQREVGQGMERRLRKRQTWDPEVLVVNSALLERISFSIIIHNLQTAFPQQVPDTHN